MCDAVRRVSVDEAFPDLFRPTRFVRFAWMEKINRTHRSATIGPTVFPRARHTRLHCSSFDDNVSVAPLRAAPSGCLR